MKKQTKTTPDENEIVHKLAIADCFVSARNSRQPKPNEPDVVALAQSLKQFGQTTPGIVRPHPELKGKWEIGAGSRRRIACGVANLKTFDAVIRDLSDDDFEELIVIENSNHVDPDPKAEVRVLERIVKRGVRTPEAISAHLGKPAHWVTRRLKLLNVIPEIRERWEKPQRKHEPAFHHFTVDMMELIGALPEETQRLFFTHDQWTPGNVHTRAQLQSAIERSIMCRLDTAPFDLNDPATFVPGCGPGCATDTSKQGKLFDLGDKCGRCTNRVCFGKRLALARSAQLAVIEKEHGDKLRFVSTEGTGAVAFADGREAQPEYSYSVTAKPTKENTEKVIALAKGKLQIGYVRKPTAASSGSNGRNGAVVKSNKKSLPDKKAALQARRWNIVHEELLKALKESKHTDCTENVEDLVAVFGLPFHALAHERLSRAMLGNKRWAIFDRRKEQGFWLYDVGGLYKLEYHKLRAAALWSGLKDVLRQITLGFHKVGDIHDAVTDMRRVAKLIKFDIDARKRAADLTIKVPRTWGSGLDVHTLEPVKVKTNDAACKAAGMKPVVGKKHRAKN